MEGNCIEGHRRIAVLKLQDLRKFWICPRCAHIGGDDADTLSPGEKAEWIMWIRNLQARKPVEKPKKPRGVKTNFDADGNVVE